MNYNHNNMDIQEFKTRLWTMRRDQDWCEINTFLSVLDKRSTIKNKIELVTVIMIFQRMFSYSTETIASPDSIFVILYRKLVDKIKSYEQISS